MKWQSAVPLFVAIVYLLTLALGCIVLKARPVMGGIAAVVALVSGRALQVYLARKDAGADG